MTVHRAALRLISMMDEREAYTIESLHDAIETILRELLVSGLQAAKKDRKRKSKHAADTYHAARRAVKPVAR
jgi:Tfp pilus assembly protein PilV